MTQASRLARFTAAVDRPAAEIELDVAALYIGDWDDDAIDVARARAELDRIAGLVAQRAAGRTGQESRSPGHRHGGSGSAVAGGEAPWSGARAIALTLFTDLGYRGNSADYYDPRNSFLSQVMARRTGIPITLSVLYLEVARRAGIDARGVGFPGHFLVRVHEDGDALVVDPFNGGAALAPADLEALMKKIGGGEARLDDAVLAEASKPQILARMLLNLAGIYGKQGDLFRSLEVLERLHVLDRENPRLARDLEQLRSRVSALN